MQRKEDNNGKWNGFAAPGPVEKFFPIPEISATTAPCISYSAINSANALEIVRMNTFTGEATLQFSAVGMTMTSAIAVSDEWTDGAQLGKNSSIALKKGISIYFTTKDAIYFVNEGGKLKCINSDIPELYLHHPALLYPHYLRNDLKTRETPQKREENAEQQENEKTTDTWTWANETYGTTDGTTKACRLVNLSTGRIVPFYGKWLIPLFTMWPRKTLAVGPGTASTDPHLLLMVDWNPPSAYNPSPSPSVSTIASLPMNALHYSFDTTGYQLHCFGEQKVFSYPNALHIYPARFEPQSRLFSPDLSALLRAQQYPIPYDLVLSQKATKSSWNVHYHILQRHDGLETPQKIDSKLVPLIENSTLSSDSILFFLRFLYFDRSLDSGDSNNLFVQIIQAIELCREIGIDARYLHFILGQVVADISNADLLRHIMDLWTLSPDPETFPAMGVLANRCRKHVTDEELLEALATFKSVATSPENYLVGAKMILYFSPSSAKPVTVPYISDYLPSISPLPLYWDESLSSLPSAPPDDPSAYIFVIDGKEDQGGVLSYSWLLYPQWKWFERLVNSNLEETKTRRVVLSARLTPLMLLAVLSVPHGTYSGAATLHELSLEEVTTLYLHSDELQLGNSPSFRQFLNDCRGLLYETISKENCIQRAIEYWEQGISVKDHLSLHTLRIIASILPTMLVPAWLDIPAGLQHIIATYFKHGADSKEFSSL